MPKEKNMKRRVYIVPYTGGDATSAWQKAPDDILTFASRHFDVVRLEPFVRYVPCAAGKVNILPRFRNLCRRLFFYVKCLFSSFGIERNSLLLLQHPYDWIAQGRGEPNMSFYLIRRILRRRNSVLGFIVHDVEELRVEAGAAMEYEKNRLRALVKNGDYIIVHNEKMLQWFVSKGVPEGKLVNLEIFDYDTKHEPVDNLAYDRSVTVAGALTAPKAAYLLQSPEIDNVNWHLYGKGLDEKKIHGSHIHYHGVFLPEELPAHLKHGFGLVWDGESIDRCSGLYGEYLRYNNPHKLSLYLASGLPVAIWDEAAEADFVKKHDVGIAVKSLQELASKLSSLTQNDYDRIRGNVLEMSKKLRNGYFTRRALNEIFDKMRTENS